MATISIACGLISVCGTATIGLGTNAWLPAAVVNPSLIAMMPLSVAGIVLGVLAIFLQKNVARGAAIFGILISSLNFLLLPSFLIAY